MSKMKTRDHIVDAADRLFYQQGFERTSFSDIADVVNISRGNFYYHFKTKDEILDAVIQLRLANTRRMLEEWEEAGEAPEARVRCFIHVLIRNQAKIKLYGCPVGTLNTELAKLNHESQVDARAIFTLFRDWLETQFRMMGRDRDADQLAMELLARSQGAATLYTAFRDDAFVEREVRQMCDWLQAIAVGTGASLH